MKNLSLENLGVEKLDKTQISVASGGWGRMRYAQYTWKAGDNELLYVAEAAANGMKLVYNGVAASWNWGYDRIHRR